MQFSAMKTEVFRRLEESSTSPVFWTEAQVEDAINEGYKELSDATEWYERNVTLFFSADTTYYNLFSLLQEEILLPRRAQNLDTHRWMTHVTYRELDEFTYKRWENNNGTPQHIFFRGMWHLGLHPYPSSDTGTMRLWFVGIPRDLNADADTPSFPQEFHNYLVDYACYDLLAQEAETAKAMIFWDRFQVGVERLRRWVNQRIQKARIGRLGGAYV